MSKCQLCQCRLKKELEEKSLEVAEPLEKVDPHQKLCDTAVKGPPGTKVESMKVVSFAYYCAIITKLCCAVI